MFINISQPVSKPGTSSMSNVRHILPRDRKSNTAAREVNKVGCDLMELEKEKILAMHTNNQLLERIAKSLEELLALKKDTNVLLSYNT